MWVTAGVEWPWGQGGLEWAQGHGEGAHKRPLEFVYGSGFSPNQTDRAADILGLLGGVHNVACRPAFSAVPAVGLRLPPGSHGN